MQDRVQQELPSGPAAAWYSLPYREDYSFKINKKEKRAALKSALTSRVQDQKFVVLDELKLDAIKTKDFVKVLNNLKVSKALVVLGDRDMIVEKSRSECSGCKDRSGFQHQCLRYPEIRYRDHNKAGVEKIEEVYA